MKDRMQLWKNENRIKKDGILASLSWNLYTCVGSEEYLQFHGLKSLHIWWLWGKLCAWGNSGSPTERPSHKLYSLTFRTIKASRSTKWHSLTSFLKKSSGFKIYILENLNFTVENSVLNMVHLYWISSIWHQRNFCKIHLTFCQQFLVKMKREGRFWGVIIRMLFFFWFLIDKRFHSSNFSAASDEKS